LKYIIWGVLCVCIGLKLTLDQATKLAKEYEKQGGDYEEEAGSKNKPKKGEPEKKED